MRPAAFGVFAFLLISLLPVSGFARTWHIQAGGAGDAPTVQAGIDSAAAGDTVLVGPGTYYENLHLRGRDIVLMSESGSEATVLDGSQAQTSVIIMEQGESQSTVIEGFTITGGTGSSQKMWDLGGGIATGDASPVIRGNIFTGNTARVGGAITTGWVRGYQTRPWPVVDDNRFLGNEGTLNAGAIFTQDTNATIRSNVFENNQGGYDGGAINMRGGNSATAEVVDNVFMTNTAGDHGGGAYIADIGGGFNVTVTGNVFYGNRAEGAGTGDSGSGGGLWLHDVEGVVERNTLARNVGLGESACSGGGILIEQTSAGLVIRSNIVAFNDGGGISCFASPSPMVDNNIIWENSEGAVCEGKCASWGFLDADPLFCDFEGGDLSVATNSPALSRGEVIGAIAAPGCPGTSVERTTWGRIKARYLD